MAVVGVVNAWHYVSSFHWHTSKSPHGHVFIMSIEITGEDTMSSAELETLGEIVDMRIVLDSLKVWQSDIDV